MGYDSKIAIYIYNNLYISFGPSHMKMCHWAYADSKGPDQPVQFYQGLCCPQTKSLDTLECFNGEQRPG